MKMKSDVATAGKVMNLYPEDYVEADGANITMAIRQVTPGLRPKESGKGATDESTID